MGASTFGYDPEAGKVLVDDRNGHPGIKATTLSYGQINDDMLLQDGSLACWVDDNRLSRIDYNCWPRNLTTDGQLVQMEY